MSSVVELTLFVPGLLAAQPLLAEIPAGQRPDLKLLETLLSRAEVSNWGTGERFSDLFRLFGFDAEGEVPVAAVTGVAAGFDTTQGWWLRADPVCLAPDRDRLVLMEDEPPLRMAESEALRATLNAHFAADGWQIEARSPNQWFIRLDEAPRITTTPPATSIGEDIHPHLPQGEDATLWRRYLNESQMLLHDHPINQQREAEGYRPIDSLWFWGGGALPPRGAAQWDQVISKWHLARALGRYHKVPLAGLMEDMCPPGRVLVCSEACCNAIQQGNVFDWLESLFLIQQKWLVPIADRLRDGARLVLLPGDERAFSIERPRGLARLWPRRRPLMSFLAP
ncbi:MAG TPA: hypothetical protein ENJ01_03885 [Gammaproteobacteria bacterium]|nr:hypothetical protein [Gammaproteobacteria bacterium]